MKEFKLVMRIVLSIVAFVILFEGYTALQSSYPLAQSVYHEIYFILGFISTLLTSIFVLLFGTYFK